jgi:hypothetical protein
LETNQIGSMVQIFKVKLEGEIFLNFKRYIPGTFFKPHFDSPYVINENERTVYTLMIFLNDDFEGGKTNFLTHDMKLSGNFFLGKNIMLKYDFLKDICPKIFYAALLPRLVI